MTRARASPVVGKILKSHEDTFVKHPDSDQLSLAMFLLYEYLKGEQSFWWPYMQVMNESDLTCFWSDEELDLLRDVELKHEALVYREEVLEEWT